MSIRVLYPVDVLRHREATGLQRYAFELVAALAGIAEVEVTVLCDDPEDVAGLPQNITRRVRGPLPGPLDRSLRGVFLPGWLNDYDVIHCPTVYGPFLRKPRGARMVATIHDLIPLVFADRVSRANRIWFRHVMPRILDNYDGLIAISEHTRRDMAHWWDIDPTGVTVIPEASHLTPTIRQAEAKNDDVLMVGTLEPRKNLERGIEAFLKVIEQRPDLPDRLVIIGRSYRTHPSLRRLIESAGDRIEWLGHVNEATLVARYRGAKALLFPSLYEGFGLPVLEAMAMGCPVIASSSSSIPEVGGGAATYFDPLSVDAIAAAITSVLADPDRRRQMQARGLEQARLFSWSRCAAETVAVYRRVVGR